MGACSSVPTEEGVEHSSSNSPHAGTTRGEESCSPSMQAHGQTQPQQHYKHTPGPGGRTLADDGLPSARAGQADLHTPRPMMYDEVDNDKVLSPGLMTRMLSKWSTAEGHEHSRSTRESTSSAGRDTQMAQADAGYVGQMHAQQPQQPSSYAMQTSRALSFGLGLHAHSNGRRSTAGTVGSEHSSSSILTTRALGPSSSSFSATAPASTTTTSHVLHGSSSFLISPSRHQREMHMAGAGSGSAGSSGSMFNTPSLANRPLLPVQAAPASSSTFVFTNTTTTSTVPVLPGGLGDSILASPVPVVLVGDTSTSRPPSPRSQLQQQQQHIPAERVPAYGLPPFSASNAAGYATPRSRSSSPINMSRRKSRHYTPLRVAASTSAATAVAAAAATLAMAAHSGGELPAAAPLKASSSFVLLPAQPLQSARTTSEPASVFVPAPFSSSASLTSSLTAAVPAAAAPSARDSPTVSGGRPRILPSLSIITPAHAGSIGPVSGVVQMGVNNKTLAAVPVPVGASASALALAATYGSRASIAAFKRAYATAVTRGEHSKTAAAQTSLGPLQQKDVVSRQLFVDAPATTAPVASSTTPLKVSTPLADSAGAPSSSSSTTSVLAHTAAAFLQAEQALLAAAAEGRGCSDPTTRCTSPGGVDVDCRTPTVTDLEPQQLQQQQPALEEKPVAVAPPAAVARLLMDSNGSRTHTRSKSHVAYAAMLERLATAATSNSAQQQSQLPLTRPTSQSVEESQPSSRVRNEQIQQLRSTLTAQQAQAQAQAQAQQQQLPPAHCQYPASAPLQWDDSIDERMTPLNILREDSTEFHEMYKQWFRDEIAAERAEAKRRAKEIAAQGGRAASPSRSLMRDPREEAAAAAAAAALMSASAPAGSSDTPRSLQLPNVSLPLMRDFSTGGSSPSPVAPFAYPDGSYVAVYPECMTPVSGRTGGAPRCFTPGGGLTLLAMMMSDSRSGSGFNTPTGSGPIAWGNNVTATNPSTPTGGAVGWRARMMQQEQQQQQQQQSPVKNSGTRTPIHLPALQAPHIPTYPLSPA